MTVLTLHTTGPEGSVALAHLHGSTVQLLAQQSMDGRTFAAAILPAIQQCLVQAGLTLPQVQAIVTASGPGSFTGVRIGLATAKGLAQGSGVAMHSASSLALLAMRQPHALAVLDAGRGDFYAAEYTSHGQHCQWQQLLTRQQLLATPVPAGCTLVCCEQPIADSLCEAGLTVLLVPPPDAASLAHWFAAAQQNATLPVTDWHTAEANYLRRTDAEVNLRAASTSQPGQAT